MLFVAMTVFAVISLLLMFAARVPAISESLHDLFGTPRSARPDLPDRSTHLFMLLFCYASPLLLMLVVSFLRAAALRSRLVSAESDAESEASDPFA
jgi:hypothetical protein